MNFFAIRFSILYSVAFLLALFNTEDVGAVILRKIGISKKTCVLDLRHKLYEGSNFNSGNYLFTTDTK